MTRWYSIVARNPFGVVPPIIFAIVIGPIMMGLFGTLLPAFGIHPAISGSHLSLDPWRAFFGDPAFGKALRLTLSTGFGATVIAVVIGFGSVALLHGSRAFDRVRSLLAPAMAFPYASFAVGLAFLVAPSGWIARLISPWATGWDQPPDLLIIGDPNAIALTLALALKESLFLILMIVGALGQINSAALMRTAQSFGYNRVQAWLKLVAPQVYHQVRLPIYAMLASSFAVVDMAIVLGPSAPPTLAPFTLDLYRNLDVAMQLEAAAASIFQLGLVVGAIGFWRLGETVAKFALRARLSNGHRTGSVAILFSATGLLGLGFAFVASFGAILMLSIWSFSASWTWPDAFPTTWSLNAWTSGVDDLVGLTGRTVIIGFVATVIATVAAILCLEAGIGEKQSRWLAITYAPLMVPQISFLFGVQLLWNYFWLDGTLSAVALTHLLFVLPYILLTLGDPYRALDPRIAIAARTLGAGRLRTLLRIKLPLLARPLCGAMAVGFAVSVAQYLPTVFAGAGRVNTLTTEAVALASGADRRMTGVVAFTLTALPFLMLIVATSVPNFLARNRRALQL